MRDIRLEEIPFEFDGKTFLLRCSMNVLADVQEEYGGSIGEALDGGSPLKSVLSFLSAMMDDYADEQGWAERYTPRQLGRRLSLKDVRSIGVMELVTRSITPDTPEMQVSDPDTSPDPDPDLSGN